MFDSKRMVEYERSDGFFLVLGEEHKILYYTRYIRMKRYLTGSLLIVCLFLTVFSLFSCEKDTPEQRGYNKIKEDIIEYLKVPSSLKVQDVKCYYHILEAYLTIPGYPYQYKIYCSAKNGLGMEVYDVVYYGYNDDTGEIIYYGDNSEKFDEAKSHSERSVSF